MAVAGLDERHEAGMGAVRVVEIDDSRESAAQIDSEDRAVVTRSTALRGPVEITIGGLHEASEWVVPAGRAKCMEGGHHTGRGHLVHGAPIACTSLIGRAIEVAIRGADDTAVGVQPGRSSTN